MPEGPEIKRSADQIAQAIVHRPAIELFFAFDRLKRYESILKGQQVLSVQPKGKALLIGFENHLSIYSHNQLYGKWYVRSAYSYPDTQRQLRLAIHTEKKSALLYSASEIEVLDAASIAHHPFLSRLGLDVLDDATSVPAVKQRFQDTRFARRSLTILLLDQGFLCGLGNYLRSEILFVAKVNPRLRPIDCTDEQLIELAKAAIVLPRQSYETGGITNDTWLAVQLREQGYHRSSYRHWVFNREGKPCFLCGTAIGKQLANNRRLYFCPICQSHGC
jgi:endonuclease-8